jgi:putative ABC transport system permease protein
VGRAKTAGRIEQQIIGVVKDFNYQSLHTTVEPLAMVIKPGYFFRRINDISFYFTTSAKNFGRLKAGNLVANLNTLNKFGKM